MLAKIKKAKNMSSMVRRLKLICWLSIVAFVSFDASSDGIKLSYRDLIDLKNLYSKSANDPDLTDGSKEYVSIMALEQRFDLCHEGLIFFSSMLNHIPIAKKLGYSKKEIFAERAKMAGYDYPFSGDEFELMEYVTDFALEFGWKLQGQELDLSANTYWKECNNLPISKFENYWRNG